MREKRSFFLTEEFQFVNVEGTWEMETHHSTNTMAITVTGEIQ